MITLQFHLTSTYTGEIGFSGVPLRAAFLNLLREYNNELSTKVHGLSGIRAYSIDPFPCDHNFNTTLEMGGEYDFSVHLFKPSAFQDVIRRIAMKNDLKLRLHHIMFETNRIDFLRRSATSLMDKWTQEVENQDGEEIKLRFDFLTPTQLSNFGSDKAYLLPTPEKVFTGLLRVWNTMENATQLEYTGEYRDWIAENVFVSGHRIQTRKVALGRNRSLLGFTGNVVYSLELSDSPFVKLTTGLAHYAEICNVGKNRSAGFGKVGVQILNQRKK